MGLISANLFKVCLLSVILKHSLSLLTPSRCSVQGNAVGIRYGSKISPVIKSSIKFHVTRAESRKLYSSVIKPTNPTPLRPGPLKFVKQMFQLAVLTVKVNYLKVLLGFTSALDRFQNVLKGTSSKGNAKDKKNGNNKKGNKFLQSMAILVRQRKFWIQMSVAGISFAITRYLAFTKSLTTEISYTNFLQLIAAAPERVAGLRVTPSAFMFSLDGKSALTRMVTLEPVVMRKLLSSGIDFAALPAPTNVLGLIWTFAYAAFIWNISTKMMQGPQDEGAGKRKDKAGDLDAYGKLSFEDVAGQERAKLEVKEVCEMLQAPEKYLTVGARLPSGVLLVGPPGTGEKGKEKKYVRVCVCVYTCVYMYVFVRMRGNE